MGKAGQKIRADNVEKTDFESGFRKMTARATKDGYELSSSITYLPDPMTDNQALHMCEQGLFGEYQAKLRQ